MPIGIMAAMPEELEAIIEHARASRFHKDVIGEREFYRGTISGVDVVCTFSHWGKVAAAVTAAHLIGTYKISRLWFTGVAGAIDPSLRIGDIVVARGLIQHDLDARPLFKRHEVPLSGRTMIETCPVNRDLLKDAAAAFARDSLRGSVGAEAIERFGLQSASVVVGDIATGDRFISSAADVRELRSLLPSCVCVEMEGAAVAQVCAEHSVPFAVLRVISDCADDSAHVDFQRFVGEVASVYTLAIIMNAIRAGAHRRERMTLQRIKARLRVPRLGEASASYASTASVDRPPPAKQ